MKYHPSVLTLGPHLQCSISSICPSSFLNGSCPCILREAHGTNGSFARDLNIIDVGRISLCVWRGADLFGATLFLKQDVKARKCIIGLSRERSLAQLGMPKIESSNQTSRSILQPLLPLHDFHKLWK